MNEIHISIAYSFFAELFGKYVYDNFNTNSDNERQRAIEQVKKYWLLLDSEQREFIIKQATKQARYYDEFKELLDWIETRRNQHQPTPQPLNAFVELPVIDTNRK
ncbi:hypothetical protein D3M79_06460 [Rodentibacter pneumotropicus]|uniref:Uncharacterized protein n=1 Tax=Rodentibacter pneumotropicus TaxID=758 RepID=A0A4S2P8X3_9PAST|nr:hypothetical protein [Rodentibacter pneumotropicus]TGZ99479.1 hypothetical protein D3M79_06460 [Rodentibacter pneumotropicus]TGZ99991.1 hypothetical protein D3M74_08650 [Rodentibacter pneumotropicus]THA09077.1 hypothetical protein D3M77_03350 [Rodentibacter pneumotropicus]THA16100.1 hypothetical protein D3M76_03680 [Rodentibacter pneumotropicus]